LVDSEGDAAVAKLEHDLPTGRWIDYASLLKVGGQWKIVGLLYVREGAGKGALCFPRRGATFCGSPQSRREASSWAFDAAARARPRAESSGRTRGFGSIR